MMRHLLVLSLFLTLSTQWVIYRKGNAVKRKIVCKPEYEWDNASSSTPEPSRDSSGSGEEERSRRAASDDHILIAIRRRRDVEIDPKRKEPIIFLGQKVNVSTSFVDDGDFDIVSDYLTSDEMKMVKEQIMNTCNYLDRDRHYESITTRRRQAN
ncbi:unnamed protein product, partial [Mesorhabditis spiculigera]